MSLCMIYGCKLKITIHFRSPTTTSRIVPVTDPCHKNRTCTACWKWMSCSKKTETIFICSFDFSLEEPQTIYDRTVRAQQRCPQLPNAVTAEPVWKETERKERKVNWGRAGTGLTRGENIKQDNGERRKKLWNKAEKKRKRDPFASSYAAAMLASLSISTFCVINGPMCVCVSAQESILAVLCMCVFDREFVCFRWPKHSAA